MYVAGQYVLLYNIVLLMTYYSTVTTKGQVTLPAKLRSQLDLKPGQKVNFSLNEKNQIVIQAPVDLTIVRSQARQYLKDSGYKEKDLQNLARKYQNGDGFTANAADKHAK